MARKISNNYLKIEEGHDLNSDHSSIYLTVSSDIAKKESIATLCSRHTDWSYFRQSNDPYPTLSNIIEIEEYSLKISKF